MAREANRLPFTAAPPAKATSDTLDPTDKAFLEERFGHRFDNMAVHDDAVANASATAIDADAFTVGQDVYFRQGILAPDSARGRHILAHEAAHVVQNRDASMDPAAPVFLGNVNDPAEVAAEQAANDALAGETVDVSTLAQSGAASAGTVVARRWPSFDTDWLTGAATSVMTAGSSLLGAPGLGGLPSLLPSFGSPVAPAPGTTPAGPDAAGGSAAAGPGTGAAAAGAAGAAPGTGADAKTAPDPKVVAQSTQALNDAMRGWGTDEARIHNVLRNKTPAEIAAIKESYQKQYGVSLDTALADEMSGDDLKEARGYLSGDPAKGATAALINASAGLGTDENKIYASLKGKTPEQIAAIKAEYKAQTGTSLDDMLKDELSGAELAEAQAWMTGNQSKGAAAALVNASAGLGTDEAKIMSTLNELSPADYLKMRKEFAAQSGQSVDDMLKDEMSGSELTDAQKALRGKFSTGLGGGVDPLATKSPTLMKNMDTLADRGWVVEFGVKGKGTFADRGAKRITVDPDEMGNAPDLVQSLAHESGHGMYTLEAETPIGKLSKEEYVKANTMHNLKDEGEATITNMMVRNEILGAKGGDIGVAGAKSDEYKKLFAKYKDPAGADRDKLREDIANVFAKGEHPSNDTGKTYEDYYGKYWADLYDKNTKKSP